jgi:DMSO/TMAO reductase YedYZ molybdopterin-dependent catalytic subunit/thiosulfate reductase cytochrome b subunit
MSLTYRHPTTIRVTHWIAVICVWILLMSGLQIFDAHPALYLGLASNFDHPIVSIDSKKEHNSQVGVTTIFGHAFNTTGVLGLSGDNNQSAFPSWATLPGYQDLATGRRWHFFFAWLLLFDGLVYLIYSFVVGHVWGDLVPSTRQLRHIGGSILDHLRLRFPRGERAKRYNVLQRLTYLLIIFLIFPLLIATGLTMSPGLDAAFPFVTAVFGGRQTARTIHFICASAVLGFVIIHVVMVLVSGVWNNMRSMITGWYTIEQEKNSHGETACAAAVCGALPLAGCDLFSGNDTVRSILDSAESLTKSAQRLFLTRQSLAQEFSEMDISPKPRANGSTDPDDPAYKAFAQSGFKDWRLEVGGLVDQPQRLSLQDLRALPARTQITRHDCVEGWSYIGKWTGVPLSLVLQRAGLKGEAKYIVFYCADSLDESDKGNKYYESIDLVDALHPQTILAYDMNGAPLAMPYGAPLRVRVERQLGYKMAKYIMRIEAVKSLGAIGGGHGSYWADNGYEWYAGI